VIQSPAEAPFEHEEVGGLSTSRKSSAAKEWMNLGGSEGKLLTP
jgi:hypothetical protein